MAFNLKDYSEGEQYDLFRRVIEAANKRYGQYNYGDAAQYRFDANAGHLNLLGVRGLVDGKVVEPQEGKWDDRIFAIYMEEKEEDKLIAKVKEYEAGTEHGSSADDATSLLLPGQHPYRLGYHRGAGDHKPLSWFEENAARRGGRVNSYKYETENEQGEKVKKRIKYRALEPYYEGTKGLRTVLDENHNIQKDNGEKINWDAAINIHHGGPWATPSSRGCQVIRHWDNYLDFIETIEKDDSIRGTEHNERATPSVGQDRPLIYTLVTGQFVQSVAQNERIPQGEPSSNGSSSGAPSSVHPNGYFLVNLPFEKAPPTRQPRRPRASAHPTSVGGGAQASSSEKRIERVWLWLHSEREHLNSKAEAQNRVSDWSDLGLSDIVYYVNQVGSDDVVRSPSAYGNYETGSTNRERLKHLCQSCKAEGIAVHLMIYISPDESLIEKWGNVSKKLCNAFTIRSIQLDAEGWWTSEDSATCRQGAQAVKTHLCDALSCDIGVTGYASCPDDLEPLLAVADYGAPQMYAIEANYGSTQNRMDTGTERHYKRYLKALEGIETNSELENTTSFQKKVVVGMSSYDGGLGPQPDRERMSMMLESAFKLGSAEGGGLPPVREIAFWSSAGLEGGDREAFVKQIAQLAQRSELTPDSWRQPA